VYTNNLGLFCAVQDPSLKQQIRIAAEAEEKESYEHRMSETWLKDLAPLGTDWQKPFLETAPWLIIMFAQTTGLQKQKHYYLVVSVPLGVLKNNSIVFTPALPSNKTNAIANTQMGNVNKFLLVWNNAFWDTNLQYIGYTPETKSKFNYYLNLKKFTSANSLMTFAFGDYATVTEGMTDSQIIREIMINLKSIYGNGIANPSSFFEN
jgi:hypothetical protein